MASGRYQMRATDDGRQRQYDPWYTSGIAGNRDAVMSISFKIRLRSFDVEGEGTVATKSEAHVAVGVDETG